jgi:hypothetical protein
MVSEITFMTVMFAATFVIIKGVCGIAGRLIK